MGVELVLCLIIPRYAGRAMGIPLYLKHLTRRNQTSSESDDVGWQELTEILLKSFIVVNIV